MARIKIEDLPMLEELSKKETKGIFGGLTLTYQLGDFVSLQEQDLATAGDDAQLANIDLQNMLQKQQQTIQMMSNISKVLHDTAMSVIRKIG